MVADGALLRGFFSFDNCSAVAALPAVLADTHPNFALFDVGGELAIAFFVMLFNFCNLSEKVGELFKAFFLRLFCEALLRVRLRLLREDWRECRRCRQEP